MNLPPSVSYSVRRLALFAATVLFVSVALPGVDPIVKLAIAAIVSGVLSFFVLSGPRKAMAVAVEAKLKGLNQRLDEGAASEDALLDAAERASNQGESTEDATRRESRS
jgi:hypothetical protein